MYKFRDLYFDLKNTYPKKLFKFIFKHDTIKALDKQDIKSNLKLIMHREDVSYLNDIFADENKRIFAEIFNEELKKIDFDFDNIIAKLDNFYETYFKNDDFNGKEVKALVDEFNKEFKKLNLDFITTKNTNLLQFKVIVNSELRGCYDKSKRGEYVDLRTIKPRILEQVKMCQEEIIALRDSLTLSGEEYADLLFKKLEQEFKILFEDKDNFKISIPNWAKGLLFCSPWIIGFAVFTLYPLIQTFIFSFNSVVPGTDGFRMTPLGWQNYVTLFTTDTDFINAIIDYLVEMLIYVPIITVVSLVLALLLNTKVKGTGFFRTIFFLPVIITSGPVMSILIEQGVTSIPGLSEIINLEEISEDLPRFVQTALDIMINEFVVILWFCGIQILVFMTALQKIDKGVYEAASIDGAKRWEKFWKVTLPAINPTIVINVVFTVVMQSIFALNPIILKIQNDMNDVSGDRGYGYSSAMAFTYFVIMIAVLVIYVLIFKSKTKKVKKVRADI